MKSYSRKHLARVMVALLERYPGSVVARVVAQELVKQRMVRELSFFIRESEVAWFERTGELTADLVSARPLKPAMRQRIGRLLKKLTGASKVRWQSPTIATGLLGGWRLQTATLEVDASLAAKLDSLAHHGS